MPDPSPIPDPDDLPAHLAGLAHEPCLLAEDVLMISHREPELWRRHAVTADHSMGKADWDLPFVVVRTHTETIDGVEVLFALLAMRAEDEEPGGALFGELACSPALFSELVKDVALPRPVPREAEPPLEGLPTPLELDESMWALLLGDDDPARA